jgi:hypothetical protein
MTSSAGNVTAWIRATWLKSPTVGHPVSDGTAFVTDLEPNPTAEALSTDDAPGAVRAAAGDVGRYGEP